MINTNMRLYNFLTFGEKNSYGQEQLTKGKGLIRMSINLVNQAINENMPYSKAQFIGLTFDKNIDSSYVIQSGDERLKVLYVNPYGRYNQVFMARMD